MKTLLFSLKMNALLSWWVVFLGAFLRISNAQELGNGDIIVRIKQEMFSLSSQNAGSVSRGLLAVLPDGTEMEIGQLPVKVKDKIASMEMKFAEIDLSSGGADPREVIRMIMSVLPKKPRPRDPLDVRMNVLMEKIPDPLWLDTLPYGNRRVECVVTNVSKMEFAVVFANAFAFDFGITAGGEIVFRDPNAAVNNKQPIFIIKKRWEETNLKETPGKIVK